MSIGHSRAMTRAFRHLLAPGRIGGLELRNRIFMSPMGSNLAEEDGTCGERILRYYEARARGGAAMVIMGSVGVAWPRGSGNQRQVALSEDRFVAPLARVADAIHAHGSRIAVQLQHAGAIAVNEPFHGLPFLVPSVPEAKAIDWPVDLTADEKRDMFDKFFAPSVQIGYREATEDDIEWLLASFAAAAVRAREAGIDGVEIHGGHGYLFSSFLSPSSNRRTDHYGGSLENRARLLTEAVRRIRAAVGADYPVWCRLDSEEYLKTDGISLEDAIRTVKLVEQAGVDAVHVTAYADASKGISFTEAHTVAEPCKYVSNTAAIKAAARVPVIGVGRIEPGDRRAADRGGQARLRGDGAQAPCRSRAAGQARRRAASADPTLHLLLHMHQPDLSRQPHALRGQCADGIRGVRPDRAGNRAQTRTRNRRRPGGDGSRTRRCAAGSRRRARRGR